LKECSVAFGNVPTGIRKSDQKIVQMLKNVITSTVEHCIHLIGVRVGVVMDVLNYLVNSITLLLDRVRVIKAMPVEIFIVILSIRLNGILVKRVSIVQIYHVLIHPIRLSADYLWIQKALPKKHYPLEY